MFQTYLIQFLFYPNVNIEAYSTYCAAATICHLWVRQDTLCQRLFALSAQMQIIDLRS